MANGDSQFNPSMSEMHLLPIFIKKDRSRFYSWPSALLTTNGHSTFTKDFDSVHMVLETFVIYYYGINTKTYEPEIMKLTYSQTEKCYQITDGQFIHPIEEFEKTVKNRSISNRTSNNRQEDLQGSRPFKSSAVSLCYWLYPIPSRTALRRIGFALFLELTVHST